MLFYTMDNHLAIYQEGSGFFARFRNTINPMALVENTVAPIRGIKMLSSGLNTLRSNRKKASVKDDHKHLAEYSADAYRSVDERTGKGYIKHLSNDEIAVYRNNGKVSVALRGTANSDDAKTDTFLAGGLLRSTDRYKRNKKHLEHVKRNLGDIHEISGHSLSGGLAHALGDEKNFKKAEIVSFNAGAGITGAYGKRKGTMYVSHGDPVSALGMTSLKHDIRVVPNKGDSILDRHAMDNFHQEGGSIPKDMYNFL